MNISYTEQYAVVLIFMTVSFPVVKVVKQKPGGICPKDSIGHTLGKLFKRFLNFIPCSVTGGLSFSHSTMQLLSAFSVLHQQPTNPG